MNARTDSLAAREPVAVRLPQPVRTALVAWADQEGQSLSVLLRRIITDALITWTSSGAQG
jgi:hypothetical protein